MLRSTTTLRGPSAVCTVSMLLLLLLICPATAATPSSLLGPVEEIALLDDFPAASQDLWQASTGVNATYTLQCGRDIPGVAGSLMQLDLRRKGDTDTAPEHNWFGMQRSLRPGAIPPNADGLRLLIGADSSVQWWISISLKIGKDSYSYVTEPTYPGRTLVEHVIRFDQFVDASRRPLTREQLASVDAIGIATSVPNATLYLERIAAYRRQEYHSWLSFACSHPQTCIYEPGQAVSVTLTPGGTLPTAAKAFRYEVTDYFQQTTAQGTVALADGSTTYTLDLTPKTHGYYELRAWWTDAAGKDLEPRSCIRAEGTMPPGLATFAVMPHTVAQNIDRSKSLGSDAFFGLHGDFLGLADFMGLTWRFEFMMWPYLEPTKPDRTQGPAPWAQQLLKEPPRPSHQFHILPFRANMADEVPAWAKSSNAAAPPFANWDDYLALVRDYVTAEKHLYPHQKPHLYGVAWEINLNMPPDNFKPPYSPAEIVELHRRVRQTIKALDPDALILGPCPSTFNPQWFESIFKAGLLEYVDGIETHGYLQNAFKPEDGGFPERMTAVNDLMRRYNNGRVLPIYFTEAGYRGVLGSEPIPRQHAQRMVRTAIILKAEGARVFLPFYGIDYDKECMGFCFNLEVEGNPWGTHRIAPKPTGNAMAACADVLEGAKPVRRVQSLGKDIWAYQFDRQGTAILAIWSPAGPTHIFLPAVGAADPIQRVDIMGHTAPMPVQDGRIELRLDESPQYIIGLPIQ